MPNASASHVLHIGLSTLVALVLSACSRTTPPAPAPSPFSITATIQDIMRSIVDPSADALWESVATTTTASGTEEKQPRTDAEWAAVRANAISLIEATNLLVMQGRRVVADGMALEDAHVPGINKPHEIQEAIDSNHALFEDYAHHLHDASVAALAAIDKKSVTDLVAAGGKIDTACEQCHLNYWYPHSPRPGS